MSITGAHALVETLILNGIERAFCVPGESYIAVLDELRSNTLGHIGIELQCSDDSEVDTEQSIRGVRQEAESWEDFSFSPNELPRLKLQSPNCRFLGDLVP
mgnify:CR=1 FL=1